MKREDVKLTPPKATELLCKNLVNTKYEDLSEDNVRIFKDRLLDMTGCIFGGAIVPEDQFFVQRFIDWGGKEEAPLFARKERLPIPAAAMINSLTARANDYGSMFFHIKGDFIASHCGETLIPTGLTFAATQPTTGKEFLANNIAAEDVTARILYTLPVRWPMDMLMVSSAAAALASRYYRLDEEQTKAALSYAALNSTDPANSYFDYCQDFKYHNAAGAQAGIMACEMAKGGWKGLEDPYYGHWGLISMRMTPNDGSVLPDLYEAAFDDVGKVYYTEASFKRGPGGIPTTSAANCGKGVRKKIEEYYGKFDPENIKQFHLYRSENVPGNYYANPFVLRNHTNALFSFQFAACCALLNGNVSVAYVQTPAILADPYLIPLTENSTMDTFESENGQKLMKLVVEMKDGKVFEDIQDYAASMHAYPEKDFLVAKFWDQFNAFGKLPKATGEKIIELADRIEELDDMREYTDLLVL
ncbi:MAG: MmgE/PrpD family protein [Lachnospiraceae bacterium]|nr:MmgE/PrpD family protein [Lachnospiraceae bacterium]